MESIKHNIAAINENIKDICARVNRNPAEITLIGVTKTIDTDRINYAIGCGINNIGENKVQEVMDKYEEIQKNVNWHLIGHLQSNKVKYIIDKVGLIHSVDSISLAEEINKKAAKHGIIKDILVQVNVAEEDTKFGIAFDDTDSFLTELSKFENIRVMGLMTIAPNFEDVELVRPIFRKLKQKFDELAGKSLDNIQMKYLSMGMTNDYGIAIEEGSNMVRIGTGIFGKRNYNTILNI